MSAAAKRQTSHQHHQAAASAPSAAEPAPAEPRVFLKVYLPASEKAAFAEEAKGHGQDASEYARFILQARKDAVLFLQLCRLRDPAFAAGLMGNPQDAGRVAELEKRVLELRHERDEATRDRDEAETHAAELERRLAECSERQQALAGYVVDLARVDAGNRERAIRAGAEYEAIPRETLLIVKALSVSPGLRRKDLEERLTADGLTAPEAAAAITAAARLDLITKGKDMRYRLAKPPQDDYEEEATSEEGGEEE